ncbi:MAG: hypothetical protein IJG53_05105, partial [Eggerthellaceae bacterium]|nr:hypothetical protein [Eggerthellaceae bacterium]
MLVDVLRGAKTDRITKRHLDGVSEYGSMASIRREDVAALVRWLIDEGFIIQTKEKYPVLHPAIKSLQYDETMTIADLRKLKKHLENEPEYSRQGESLIPES